MKCGGCAGAVDWSTIIYSYVIKIIQFVKCVNVCAFDMCLFLSYAMCNHQFMSCHLHCYDQVTWPKSSECPATHCEDGSAKAKSVQCEHMETTEDSMKTFSPNDLPSLMQDKESENVTHIAVSARQNKRTILSDKSNRSNKRTRNTKSSRTSGPASTLSARDSYGWWTKSCEDLSKKLWSPTEIDCAVLPTSSSSGFVRSTEPLSWSRIESYAPQSKSSQRISWPLYMSSRAGTTESEDTQKTPKSLVRCQKIRLRPTTKQAQKLRQWMIAARNTYNSGLRLIKDGKAKPTLLLKKLVVTRRKEDGPKVQQMKQTPADIRSRAIMDLIDAFKTAQEGFKARKLRERTQKGRWKKRKKKEKNLGRRRWRKRVAYHINYKSKRLTSDSFGFEQESINIKNGELFLFARVKKFGMQDGIKMSEVPGQPIDACSRIQYLFGRWYLLLPYQVEIEDTCLVNGRVGALDPGVRTFQAFYSEDECGEIAPDTEKKALAMKNKIEGIRELIDILKDKGGFRLKINRLTKAWYRANARASNLASDLHFKTIKFLFDRFDVIIAPRLGVASMLRRDSNLSTKTKVTMRFQQHGAFHSRLWMKAESCGKIILDLEEHGTSQTCSSCGQANRKLGSAKVFKCAPCGFQADRDVNSSKNHLLKALVGEKHY